MIQTQLQVSRQKYYVGSLVTGLILWTGLGQMSDVGYTSRFFESGFLLTFILVTFAVGIGAKIVDGEPNINLFKGGIAASASFLIGNFSLWLIEDAVRGCYPNCKDDYLNVFYIVNMVMFGTGLFIWRQSSKPKTG